MTAMTHYSTSSHSMLSLTEPSPPPQQPQMQPTQQPPSPPTQVHLEQQQQHQQQQQQPPAKQLSEEEGSTITTTPPKQPPQQLQQQQQQLYMKDDTSMNISRSTQVGVLVEREVGKLTRHCRMLGGEEETKECDFIEDVEDYDDSEEDYDDSGNPVAKTTKAVEPQGATTTTTAATLEGTDVATVASAGTTTTAVSSRQHQQSKQRPPEIPQFDRSEIMAWTLLGNGAFSEVYQVWGFRFQDEFHQTASPNQQAAREHVQATALSTVDKDQKTQRCNYVIKHLRSDLKASTDKSRFVHAASDLVMEALFLTKLDHANIIRLRGTSHGIETFGNGHHDGFFLLLDRLDCTLADKINCWARSNACRQRVFSRHLSDYAEKVDLALQIARGLEYLHDRDIVFRDLKPDNIGIQNRTVKIFDFGLCRELPEESPPQDKVYHMSGVGTRRYMAPEIFLTQHYNLKVDVYSFAIVLHCMLSLVRPFEKYNAHLHTLLVCKEGARPPIPYEWPEELCDLLRYGWAHKPSDRPTMKEATQLLEKLHQKIARQAPLVTHKEQPYSGSGIRTSPSSAQSTSESSCSMVGWNLLDQVGQTLCDDQFQKKAGNVLRSLEMQLIEGGVTWSLKRRNPNHYKKLMKEASRQSAKSGSSSSKSTSKTRNYSGDRPHHRHLRSNYL